MSVKRIFDFIVSLTGLIICSPIMIPVMVLVWLQDFHSPFYIAPRVGKDEKLFKMIKLRSMIIGADKSGVDSTSSSDSRITGIGRIIRQYKLDELSQLFNVLSGEMSLVGPRPNVRRETDLYTREEKLLLTIKPGITDISSIVFSDEGEILKNQPDPDIAYNQLIRPWKSRLGIFYVNHRTFMLDIKLIYLTVLSIISREKALAKISGLLAGMKADKELIEISLRKSPLTPAPPPGTDKIVTSRDGKVDY